SCQLTRCCSLCSLTARSKISSGPRIAASWPPPPDSLSLHSAPNCETAARSHPYWSPPTVPPRTRSLAPVHGPRARRLHGDKALMGRQHSGLGACDREEAHPRCDAPQRALQLASAEGNRPKGVPHHLRKAVPLSPG